MAKRTLLIDGDLVVHRTAAAIEQPIDWGDGLWTLHAHETDGEDVINRTVEQWNTLFEAPDIIWVFSDDRNFRHDIYPEYKANRSGTKKPLLHKYLREYVTETADRTYLKENLEADDAIGILATHPTLVKGEKIIVSLDKDFATIPGKQWRNEVKGKRPVVIKTTKEQADRNHLIQTMTGDATDNYPGCPGVGAVTAARVLDKAEEAGVEPWDAVVSTFEKKGCTAEDALLNARLARILRASDYDFKRKEPILWTAS